MATYTYLVSIVVRCCVECLNKYVTMCARPYSKKIVLTENQSEDVECLLY